MAEPGRDDGQRYAGAEKLATVAMPQVVQRYALEACLLRDAASRRGYRIGLSILADPIGEDDSEIGAISGAAQ